MATKAKAGAKPGKKAASTPSGRAKSLRLKPKGPEKNAVRKTAKATVKGGSRRPSTPPKVESGRTSVVSAASLERAPERTRSRQFDSAVQAYEAGIKSMHAEEFEKAIKHFTIIIEEHPDEPEIQERAKVLLHACEKKIQDKGRAVLRSADDHYNVGVAELNRRSLDSAVQHLQQALKLAPKADHVLYALAAANALQGNRDQAIQYRPENRFQALRDSDFESLQEDADFKRLVTHSEK